MLSIYDPEIFDPTQRPMAGTPLNPYWEAEYQPALLLPCWEGAGGALEDVSGHNLSAAFSGGATWAPSVLETAPKLNGSTGTIALPDMGLTSASSGSRDRK